MRQPIRVALIVAALVACGSWRSPAAAQVFGTFSWQMQPFCNVVTLTLTRVPSGYTVDGNDRECLTATLNSATGQAFINPDGNVGIRFTIVTSLGEAVHISAVVSPVTGHGTWLDDVGHNGVFALGASTGGSNRPSSVYFRVRGHATALTTSGVPAPVIWADVTGSGGGGVYDAAAGTYTAPSAGVYLVTTTARWPAFTLSAGYKCLFVKMNSDTLASTCDAPSTTATFQIQSLSAVFYLPAGSLIRIDAFQDSGGNQNIGDGSLADTHLSIMRLSR